MKIGNYKLEWANVDEVRITMINTGYTILVDGGDLEQIFGVLFCIKKEPK
jgi:hypothetical protein